MNSMHLNIGRHFDIYWKVTKIIIGREIFYESTQVFLYT